MPLGRSVRGRWQIGPTEIAFPEMQRDFFEGALFPFLRLRKPKPLALRIQGGTLATQILLTRISTSLFMPSLRGYEAWIAGIIYRSAFD
jgi:hypothetical protein